MSRHSLHGVLAALLWLTTLETTGLLAQPVEPAEAAARDYNVALAFQKKQLFGPAATRWQQFLQAYPQDPKAPTAQLNLGICLFGDKKFPEAVNTFREGLQKYPAYQVKDRVQFNLSMANYNIALQLDEAAVKSQAPADRQKADEAFKKAAAEFALVPQQYPQSSHLPDSLYYQAECFYLAGDKKAALPVYQQLVANHGGSAFAADGLYGLATTQADLELQAEAVANFEQLVTKFPQDQRVHECRLRQGMALHALQKYPEAEQRFAQLAGIQAFPHADFALMRQALALQEQNKLPEAAAAYESLPGRFKESSYVGPALLAAGKCRFRVDQFPQAQAAFQAVVSQKLAEAPEAANLLGRTLIRLQKPAEAVPILDAAIAAFPNSELLPDLTFTRIEALAEQPPQRPATPKLYAEFFQKYPKQERAAEALYRATFLAWEAKDYPSARQYAAMFLAHADFAKQELRPEVYYLAAECHLLDAQPDIPKAEALYRSLVAEHAQSARVPGAKVRIGYCLYSARKLDEAIAFLNPSLGELKEPDLLAEAHLLIGRSHSEAGRVKESVAPFRAALAAQPKWERGDETLYLLGRSLRLDSDNAGATQEFNKLLQQYPQSVYLDRGHYQLGEIDFEAQQYDNAINQYRKVVTTFPASEVAPLAWYGLALTLFQKNDWKTTVTELDNLLTKHPQHEIAPSGFYLRGRSHFQLLDYPKAVADLTKFLESKPTTPDGFVARHTLGKCQAAQKQFAEAAATFTALLKEKPDYPQADSLHYDLALAYLDAAQPKPALETFQALVTKHPQSPLAAECWFRLGELQENSEQPAEAVKSFTAGLQAAKAPELREKLHHKLGWLQFQQQNFPAAAAAFQEQLKEFPQGELALPGRYFGAESFYKQSKFDAALPLYATVVAARPEKYHANALYRTGDCAAALKQWKQSEEAYNTLIGNFPKFANVNEARYGLGLAYQMQNQFDAAKQAYGEVCKATNTPTAAKSRYMMGECAFAQKKFEEAYQHFLEAAAGYPAKDDYRPWLSKSHYEAARCFIQLQQPEQARQELKTVIEKYAEFPEAKSAQTLLDGLK